MRRLLLAVTVAIALGAMTVGCGGGDSGSATGTASPAEVAPRNALAYVALNTDLESGQWEQVKELVRKFPDHARLENELLDELADEGVDWERDVDPAIGPEIGLVVLSAAGDDVRPIALTQPDDEQKLDALLAKGDEPSVRREIDGWQAIAETAAQLDAFERALEAGSLSEADGFTDAMGDLPEESVAKVYVNGRRLEQVARAEAPGAFDGEIPGYGRLEWLAASLEAVDEGFKAAGRMAVERAQDVPTYSPRLLDRVPAGAIAVASFNGVEEALRAIPSQPALRGQLPMLEQALGVSLDDLGSLFAGEGVVYVRQGAPIPEVTVISEVDDASRARTTLERLASRVAGFVGGTVGTGDVGGTATRHIELRGVRASWAVVGKTLVLTTSRTSLGARDGERTLSDDPDFAEVKEAAGLGDTTGGFVYLDLAGAVPLLEGFAGLAGDPLPPEVSRNLAPLRGFLAHGGKDGDVLTFAAFLGID